MYNIHNEFGKRNLICNEKLFLVFLVPIFCSSLKNEDDEPLYTYTDIYLRHFFRNSKGGEVGTVNLGYQREISYNKFDFIKEELFFNGKIFDIVEEKDKIKKIVTIYSRYVTQAISLFETKIDEKRKNIL